MRKSSVIIISILLICFIVTLSCGLFYTATPSQNRVTNLYLKEDYRHRRFALNDYTIRTFGKDELSVIVVWYKNEVLARDGFTTLNRITGSGKVAIKRGLAVAFGDEEAVKIFERA